MPQDAESGQKARAYGLETAGRIGEQLGAERVSPSANEFIWKGRRVTIRCARHSTQDVGASYAMLDRVDSVIAALEQQNGSYHLFELSADVFLSPSRDSKNQGRIALVRRRVFEAQGTFVAAIDLTERDDER